MKTINVFTLSLAIMISINGNASTGAGNGPDLSGEALPMTVERLINLSDLKKITQDCLLQAMMELCENIADNRKSCKVAPAVVRSENWDYNMAEFSYVDKDNNTVTIYINPEEMVYAEKDDVNASIKKDDILSKLEIFTNYGFLKLSSSFKVSREDWKNGVTRQMSFIHYKESDMVTDILGQYQSVTKVSISPKKLVNPYFINVKTGRQTPLRFPGENHRNCLIRSIVSHGK